MNVKYGQQSKQEGFDLALGKIADGIKQGKTSVILLKGANSMNSEAWKLESMIRTANDRDFMDKLDIMHSPTRTDFINPDGGSILMAIAGIGLLNGLSRMEIDFLYTDKTLRPVAINEFGFKPSPQAPNLLTNK